jgi:hypothetical protein
MLPIRDIKGELAALREKEIELRAQHAEQLVRLLQETKADELDPTLLAGLLLTAVEEKDQATLEVWRKRGQTFFRPPPRPKRRQDPAPAPEVPEGTRHPPSAAATG